eukprot:CCRYP_018165-RA/>CCRYP_018165-RA protein AED:0.42 eAED:0.42 QI:0/0/0/1/0/0/3/0/199
MTLNLLRQSNATPTLSVYAHLCGPFDYNKMPLAPMGCEVQVHEKTNQCGTWAYHCVDGWYLFTFSPPTHTHNVPRVPLSLPLTPTPVPRVTTPALQPHQLAIAMQPCCPSLSHLNPLLSAQGQGCSLGQLRLPHPSFHPFDQECQHTAPTRPPHGANAVEDFKTGRFLSAFRKLESQVERALAVLDNGSGKQLIYGQLP